MAKKKLFQQPVMPAPKVPQGIRRKESPAKTAAPKRGKMVY